MFNFSRNHEKGPVTPNSVVVVTLDSVKVIVFFVRCVSFVFFLAFHSDWEVRS